jgi:hypothetical protein
MVSLDDLYDEASIARQQYDGWLPWHCADPICTKHMCVVRRKKLHKLRLKLNILGQMYSRTLQCGRSFNCIDSSMFRVLSFQSQ